MPIGTVASETRCSSDVISASDTTAPRLVSCRINASEPLVSARSIASMIERTTILSKIPDTCNTSTGASCDASVTSSSAGPVVGGVDACADGDNSDRPASPTKGAMRMVIASLRTSASEERESAAVPDRRPCCRRCWQGRGWKDNGNRSFGASSSRSRTPCDGRRARRQAGAGQIVRRRHPLSGADSAAALAEYLETHGLGRVAKRLATSGVIEVVATAAPGIDDIVVLGKIKQLEQSGDYDLIVVDGPAAGHAITFLMAPVNLLKLVRGGPIHSQATDVAAMLTDPERSQVILVTLPETTPVNEAIETAEALRKDGGLTLGPVVVNAFDEGPIWISMTPRPTRRCAPLPSFATLDASFIDASRNGSPTRWTCRTSACRW